MEFKSGWQEDLLWHFRLSDTSKPTITREQWIKKRNINKLRQLNKEINNEHRI